MKFLSLKFKLLFFCVIISIVLTLVLSIFEINRDIARYVQDLERDVKKFESAHQGYISSLVWAMEYSSLASFVNGEVGQLRIDSIGITDIRGSVITRAGEQPTAKSIVYQFDLTYYHNDSTISIGRVFLGGNVPSYPEMIQQNWHGLIIVNGLLVLIIFSTSYLIFYNQVLKRLTVIKELTEKNFPDNSENEKFLPVRSGFADEITLLSNSLLEQNKRIMKEFQRRVEAENALIDKNTLLLIEIGERQRAEQSLIEREEQYRAVVENTGDYIMRYDKNGRHIYANKNILEVTGFQKDQYFGKTHQEMGFPEHLCQLLEERIERVFHSGSPETIEFNVELAGSLMTFDLQLSPEFSDDGSVQTVIGISRNISERKRIEEKLHDSILNLNEAVRAARVGLWNWDLKTDEVTYSTEWKRQIGYEENEIMNSFSEWEMRVHPDDLQSLLDVVKKSMKEINQDYRVEYRFRHKNGSYLWILTQASFILDEDGTPLKMLGSNIDITEQKKLEIQLNQAQKMEAIGTLAGGIAHDFNNILAAILGYAEMAREDVPPDSTVAKDLDQVLEGCIRAKDLVQQILAFSRQDEMEKIPLKPGDIVEEAIKMLRPSLPTTIEISQDIDSATGMVLADPTQMHQMVMNLCTNAYHAMEETGGKLDISLKEVTLSIENLVHEPGVKPGSFVQFSISDSGPGIPPDIRKNIFDPYFTTKETGKGTGMGLAIVHGIVKSYGGFISLSSEPGEGTTFHVFIPVTEKELLPEIEDKVTIPVGSDRILFVDDEEILGEMGKSMLERLGYDVTVKSSSLEALETFQHQPDLFDLVITDQTMPGMTGADIARRMIQIRPDIPIILCTGYSTVISEEKAKAMGIKEFAMKPLARKDIAVLIRKVLAN